MTMADRWLTFDCYGTMIDWRTGMSEALESVAPGRSADLIEAYHRFEPEVEAERPFRNYRAVLAESLRRAADSIDVALSDSQRGILGETLPCWPAFPDSVEALEQLRDDGYKLGILSNTDVDLLQKTLVGPLPVPFDEVITAEEVHSYKPGDGMFDEFLARHSPGPGEWIHIGRTVWHDCEPAYKRGFRSVLVYRSDTPKEGGCADLVIRDLATLPAGLKELA